MEALLSKTIPVDPVISISSSRPVADAIRTLQEGHGEALVVIENNNPVGIFSTNDLLDLVAQKMVTQNFESLPVSQAMKQSFHILSVELPAPLLLRSAALTTSPYVLLVDKKGQATGILKQRAIRSFLPLLSKNGHLQTGSTISLHDNSNRDIADKNLKEERYRLALKASGAGTWEWDLRSDKIFWSSEMERIWGFTPGEFKGSFEQVEKKVHPEDLKPWLQSIRNCLTKGVEHNTEFRVVWPDGTIHYVAAHGNIQSDSDGKPEKMLGILIDITKRKQIEEALLESEQRYRSTMENMLEGCQIISPDWRYVYVNNAVAQQGGLKKEELLGRRMMDAYPGIDKTDMFAILKRCMLDRISISMENEFTRPDGTSRWYDLSVQPVPEGIVIFSLDITDRRKREQRLSALKEELEELVNIRTAELQSVNEELESFSYSVSHDLRAPLRAMAGFSTILLEDHREQLNETGSDLLQRIYNASIEMGLLIDGLLQLSRSSAGVLHKEPVDLSHMAREICHRLERENPDHHMQWKIQEDLNAVCDRQLIKVVLENLLANAWKFTAHKKNPQLIFKNTNSMESDPRRQGTTFSIQDNGAGFDMRYAEKLFTPFQRLHRQEEFKGSGIGLATVKRIIHRHHGEITGESQPGKGAIFYFTLPGKETK